MNLHYRRGALRDLEEIYRFIAADDAQAASAVVRRIRASTLRLELFPRSGRQGRHEETFELVVPGLPYIVVYTVDGEDIDIRAIYHGARDRG